MIYSSIIFYLESKTENNVNSPEYVHDDWADSQPMYNGQYQTGPKMQNNQMNQMNLMNQMNQIGQQNQMMTNQNQMNQQNQIGQQGQMGQQMMNNGQMNMQMQQPQMVNQGPMTPSNQGASNQGPPPGKKPRGRPKKINSQMSTPAGNPVPPNNPTQPMNQQYQYQQVSCLIM